MATPRSSKNATTNIKSAKSAAGSAPAANSPGRSGSSVTLSARTCIEMVPKLSDPQLDYEIQYLHTLDPSWTCKATSIRGKRDNLLKHLNKSLQIEMDKTIDNFASILKSISCAVECATETVRDITAGALELIDGAKERHSEGDQSQTTPSGKHVFWC